MKSWSLAWSQSLTTSARHESFNNFFAETDKLILIRDSSQYLHPNLNKSTFDSNVANHTYNTVSKGKQCFIIFVFRPAKRSFSTCSKVKRQWDKNCGKSSSKTFSSRTCRFSRASRLLRWRHWRPATSLTATLESFWEISSCRWFRLTRSARWWAGSTRDQCYKTLFAVTERTLNCSLISCLSVQITTWSWWSKTTVGADLQRYCLDQIIPAPILPILLLRLPQTNLYV